MAALNKFQYPAVFLLETLGDQLWGFKPNLMAEFVAQQGPRRALVWFARNMPKYERILEAWGPIRTHLVTAVISTLNGCAYCTAGHAYALQLHYLKKTDRLFPLSEAEIFQLHGLPTADMLSRLEVVLAEAGLSQEIFLLQRLMELSQDVSLAVTERDHQLCQLIVMFQSLNFCGISGEVKSDQAHDPINKDRGIRDRYAALRRSQLVAQTQNQSRPPQPVSADIAFGNTVLSPDDYL